MALRRGEKSKRRPMTDALDILRQHALQRRIKGIAGGLRIEWSASDMKRIHDHVMAAPEKTMRAAPMIMPKFASGHSVRLKFSEAGIAVREKMQDGDLNFAFVISSSSIDLAGDSITPSGIDTRDFASRNPAVLDAHDSSAAPIAISTTPSVSDNFMTAVARFPQLSISEASDRIGAAVRAKLLRGASIGFVPLKWSFAKDPSRGLGIDFLEVKLLEWSICSVPCNPDCIVVGAVSDGKSAGPLLRSGRAISADNEALLREAIDHHGSATKCIKDVLDSNDGMNWDPDEDKRAPARRPLLRSGRAISAANKALLREAMDHHRSATECVKDVLDRIAVDPDDDEGNHVPDKAAARQREARALALIAKPTGADAPLTRAQRIAEARNIRRALDGRK